MLRSIALATTLIAATGCIQRQQYNYNYPDYPYYTADDSCGSSASSAQCAWAKAQVKNISEEGSAVTWGSVVALTLLASVDVEPER